MVQREIIQGLILTIEVAWVALGRYFSNKWGQNRRLPLTYPDRATVLELWENPPVQLCHFRFRRLHRPYRRKLTIHARLIDGVCRDCGQRNRGFKPNRRFRLQPRQWIRRG